MFVLLSILGTHRGILGRRKVVGTRRRRVGSQALLRKCLKTNKRFPWYPIFHELFNWQYLIYLMNKPSKPFGSPPLSRSFWTICLHNRLILIVTMKSVKNNTRITQIRWIEVDRSVGGLHLGRGSAFAINDSSSCSHQPTICSRSLH